MADRKVNVDFIKRDDGLWIVWRYLYLPPEEWKEEFMPALKKAVGMPAAGLRNEGSGRWVFDEDDLMLYGLSQDDVAQRTMTFMSEYFARVGRECAYTITVAEGAY